MNYLEHVWAMVQGVDQIRQKCKSMYSDITSLNLMNLIIGPVVSTRYANVVVSKIWSHEYEVIKFFKSDACTR